jgi:FkbM family methyltransferase
MSAPWRVFPEIQRLEASAAETAVIVARLEQSFAREIAELRREIGAQRNAPPFGCLMPDGTLLTQTIHGNRYFIDPLDAVTGPEMIVSRQWEADISALLLSAADRNLVFVDVGANFGYFTCLVGSRIGRAGPGRVYAIEPNPACLALLRRNVEINWSMCPVEICDCAVGATEGAVKLYVPAHHSANGSLGDADNMDWSNFPSHDVQMRPLDALISPDVAVDVMKVDVEGHEHAAISGARAIVARSPRIRIVMEWSPGQMVNAGGSTRQMLALMHELGLQASRIAPDFSAERLRDNALGDEELLALGYDNIILTRRGFWS